MNTFRSILFFLWMYGWMTIMSIVWLPSLFMARDIAADGTRLYTRIIRWGLHHICGVRTEFRGLENLPDGPFIYAGKHHCMWDVFIPWLTLDDPAMIMKRELLFYPGFGWYALKTDMVPINRKGNMSALKKMLAFAKDRVTRQGRQIVIFPEGTRFKPGVDPEYQAAGISGLNNALNIPTVPVATNAGLCWPANGLTRTPGVAVYEFLPPIEAGLKRKAYMARLKDALEPATEQLIDEGLKVQGRSRQDLEDN